MSISRIGDTRVSWTYIYVIQGRVEENLFGGSTTWRNMTLFLTLRRNSRSWLRLSRQKCNGWCPGRMSFTNFFFLSRPPSFSYVTHTVEVGIDTVCLSLWCPKDFVFPTGTVLHPGLRRRSDPWVSAQVVSRNFSYESNVDTKLKVLDILLRTYTCPYPRTEVKEVSVFCKPKH